MRTIKFLLILTMSCMTSAATFEDYRSVDVGGDMAQAFKTIGQRPIRRRSANQEKRDISLSYTATNIKNKEGTQVKTITVIKNSNENNPKLKINPELHKNENWAQSFKDNFDKYGVIPDVPDIDDLFDYVNKKHSNDKNENKETKESKETKTEEKKVKEEVPLKPKQNAPSNENEKPVTEISSELSEENKDIKSSEKIKGDAELLPSFNSSRLQGRESLINLNHSTPKQSVHQKFEKYVQLSQGGKEFGYEYSKPCVHAQPVGSVTIATETGRTYNIPSSNNSNSYPYLAPSVTRRPQIQQQNPQTPPVNGPTFPINSYLPPLQQPNNNNNINNPIQNNVNGPTFPINSYLPPLQQPNNNNNNNNNNINNPIQNNVLIQQQNSAADTQQQQPPNFQTNQQQPPQPPQNVQVQNNGFSTSQRPYVAPNIRFGLSGLSRGPSSSANANGFQNGPSVYHINTFNNGFRKPNLLRSRGLKY